MELFGVGSGTYSFITTSFWVVWDVAYHVLTPNKWVVIVGLELAGDKLRPSVKGLQILLFEHS